MYFRCNLISWFPCITQVHTGYSGRIRRPNQQHARSFQIIMTATMAAPLILPSKLPCSRNKYSGILPTARQENQFLEENEKSQIRWPKHFLPFTISGMGALFHGSLCLLLIMNTYYSGRVISRPLGGIPNYKGPSFPKFTRRETTHSLPHQCHSSNAWKLLLLKPIYYF